MIATAIITAPRPKPTLEASIASWRDAGFMGTLMVFDDGPQHAVWRTSMTRYQHNNPALGNLRNWVLALETLFSESDDEWLMVCEDDISWAKGAALALAHDLPLFAQSASYKRTGAQSLYCPIRVSNDLERKRGAPLRPGWHGINHGMKTWGAQCLVFSRSQAAALLHSSALHQFLAAPRWSKNVDAIVAESLITMGVEISYRIPCLVDHDLGKANSSLGYKDDRPTLETKYFTGQP